MKIYYKYFVYTVFIYALFPSIKAQSLQDMQKMRAEYEKFAKDRDQPNETLNITEKEEPFPQKENIITPYAPEIEEQDTKKYFGYNFFTSRDTIQVYDNLPPPKNYILGPGDQVILSLWGETQIRNTFRISREGKIYDDKVGLLNLSGKTLDSALLYLKNQYGRVYSTLNGKNPTTFIDVSLGEFQSINVNFVGQVNFPGVHTLHPFSSLILGLIQAGGVDTTGSLRNIEIRRDNTVINKIDLYDFFIKGSDPSSLQLRDQDIVLVPPRQSYVVIDSAVARPAIYESILGESIYDLIQFSGGPSFDASEKVGVFRLKPIEERINGSIYEATYVDYNSTKLIPAGKNDKIFVNRLFDEVKQVEIIGQVKSPGEYLFSKGMTVLELFELSGGFADSTFMKSVYLNKFQIIRKKRDGRYDEVITLSLQDVLNNNEKNYKLQNLDKVVIHSNVNFHDRENIVITGEVRVPGSYPLIKDNESLESILNRAGGLTSKALDNGIGIFRNNKYYDKNIPKISVYVVNEEDADTDDKISSDKKIKVAWSNTDLTLMPGDSISVKERTSTVFITGEVYNPGVLEYYKGKSIRYYINASGGITENGNKNFIILYPSGVVVPKKWYTNPKVPDGSTIIVKSNPPKEPFNMTEFATNWTSIISSMVTVVVLSKQL